MMTTRSRIVFMGTPDFAVPTLQSLIDAPAYEVAGVVTQPDRPAGRGRQVQQSPVKRAAIAANVPVIQPEMTHTAPAFEQLQNWRPDFIIVVAFGQILRQAVLSLPHVAPINVHASLLPRWRGAAPIQASIRAGDYSTGVTTMIMDVGLDTGPILLQDSIPISPNETGQSLHDKLAPLGARLLIHTLDWLLSGSIQPHPQPDNPALVTIAPQISKEDGLIDWTQPAHAIDRHVRAFTPWPGTFTTWDGKRLKILDGYAAAGDFNAPPGCVIAAHDLNAPLTTPFAVSTGKGLFAPTRVQIEGRGAVDAAAFTHGAPGFIGAQLG